MSQNPASLDDFRGTARLFPLPNLVLFPHVAQPLHIFEPRYRQMMADALADDRLLAMALLRPGWEEDYQKQPPIYSMVCLGRIVQEEHLADGRYNLVLQGLSRARIREEVGTSKLYRLAHVDLCPDEPAPQALEQALRGELGQGVKPFFSAHPPAAKQLRRLLDSPLDLGSLCDIFCYALPLEVEAKQQLLEAVGVESRVRLLLRTLEERTPPVASEAPKRPFPPEFSEN
jgi:Lon protease-like protein